MADRSSKKTRKTKKTHKKATFKPEMQKAKKAPPKVFEEPEVTDDYLSQISNDIQRLNDEALAQEELYPSDPVLHMIHHTGNSLDESMVFDDSGLDGSVSFEFQEISTSGLKHTMLDLRGHNSIGDNQVYILLDSIYEHLDEE